MEQRHPTGHCSVLYKAVCGIRVYSKVVLDGAAKKAAGKASQDGALQARTRRQALPT